MIKVWIRSVMALIRKNTRIMPHDDVSISETYASVPPKVMSDHRLRMQRRTRVLRCGSSGRGSHSYTVIRAQMMLHVQKQHATHGLEMPSSLGNKAAIRIAVRLIVKQNTKRGLPSSRLYRTKSEIKKRVIVITVIAKMRRDSLANAACGNRCTLCDMSELRSASFRAHLANALRSLDPLAFLSPNSNV